MRRTRGAWWVAAAALALAATAARAQSADRTERFPIVAVGDSTLSIGVGGSEWVRPGARGIAIDQRRHDTLVARFTVLTVEHGVAVALVTGETTRVGTQYVAVLERPVEHWFSRGLFWAGTLTGLVLGLIVGHAR